MKKKTGLILSGVVLFSLVLVVGFVMAVSEEATADATVIVNTFVDITITDTAPAGFNFGGGGLDPGTTNNKEDSQVDGTSITPAATITRQATSNVDVKVRLKGSDFTANGDTIPITNVDYDDDGLIDDGDSENLPQTGMTTGYPGTAYATLTIADSDLKVWFWLDVASGQAAGSYTSTFSFEGNSA